MHLCEENKRRQAYKNGAEALLADFIKKNEKWIETADGQGEKGEWIKYEVPKMMEWGAGNTPITSDETVTFWMTPAQRAYLYLESRNSDNVPYRLWRTHFPGQGTLYGRKEKQAMSSGVTVKLSPIYGGKHLQRYDTAGKRACPYYRRSLFRCVFQKGI